MAEGIDAFFKYYWPRLVRYLKARSSDSALAEDVAADAIAALWDEWDRLLLTGHPRPDSWLFLVATRRLRQLEARAREGCHLDEDLAAREGDLRIAAATDMWIEDHIDLIAGMRSLPDRQCEVLGLHYFAGFTLAETAQILGIGTGTAKKHLYRGLVSLREREGITDTLKAIRMMSA
jgi:RNA polymerase sigma-70 factor, ECF subfamily